MTDLDLTCEEPIKIGLLGAIGFISFSIGSALITRVADVYGRRSVIIWASLVTPAGMVLLIFFAKYSLYIIYAIVFSMGLTYNSRGSTAYLFGCEFLPSRLHMVFGQLMFLIVGILMISSSLLFMWTKSQTLYFIVLSSLMLVAIAWVAFFAPESPHFLLSKERYEDLFKSLGCVCKVNRNYDEDKIKSIVKKLKFQNEQEQ